jgi:DNA-binding transcriptional ArsR family regulator
MTRCEPESDVFKAIADPTRRLILAALADRPLAVHELSGRFPISRPAISRHLRLLGQAKLVGHGRRGKENVYTLNRDAFAELADWLGGFWSGRLELLKRIAEGDS